MEPPHSSRPNYGIDAPGVIRNLLLAGGLGLAIFLSVASGQWSGKIWIFQIAPMGLGIAVGCVPMGFFMIWASKVGKLRERDRLLDLVSWRDDEKVLDVGCGRGLLLIGAAKHLKTGTAVGIDLWQAKDLSGNRPEATLANARCEGVADRVEVQTGDMRQLPFSDRTFDVIVSMSAIHNLYDAEDRRKAISEIARVLKPAGRIVINDILHHAEYARHLAASGLDDVEIIGSLAVRLFLAVVSFGNLRPATIVARRKE